MVAKSTMVSGACNNRSRALSVKNLDLFALGARNYANHSAILVLIAVTRRIYRASPNCVSRESAELRDSFTSEPGSVR